MSKYSLSNYHRRSIRKRAVFGLLLILLVLSLAACSKRVDGRLMEPLSITVSKSQAAVGEPITVTMTGGFVNLAAARSPDLIVADFRLGACFGKTGTIAGGLCLDKDSPLPSYIVIAEGQSYQKTFDKQVIRRGQEVTLKHSFSFTSTEPGSVGLFAVSQRKIYEDSDSPGIGVENSLDVEVQFE